MSSLRELQSQFMGALLDETVEQASLWVQKSEIPPENRIGIYQGNVRANFLDALRLTFPVTRRLVGEDYFNHIARGFHRSHPSHCGDLHPAGRPFADYLAVLHATDDYRYLKDVAAFEWLLQETLLAAEHQPLDLSKLQQMPSADYESLKFKLHPTARLFRSQFPCWAIWRANIDETKEPEVINLDGAADCLLLLRVYGQLAIHILTTAEARLLASLHSGAPLKAAVDCGGDDLDATAALQRLYQTSAIVDVGC
jgi:hypothetical protein